jgi:hypothetical protein
LGLPRREVTVVSQAALADPVSEASEVAGLEQFMAFGRNAVYR